MATDTGMNAVDELLASTEAPKPISVPGMKEMPTGVYDTQFFMGTDQLPVSPLKRLEDARIGLDIFLEETTRALEVRSDELTPDQRLHVSQILTFIEALGTRFDRVKVPNFVQKRRSRP